jgi:hypothetical protein
MRSFIICTLHHGDDKYIHKQLKNMKGKDYLGYLGEDWRII